MAAPIDVWNVATFDDDLSAELRANAELIRSYMLTNRKHFVEYERSDHTVSPADNPYAREFQRFVEVVGLSMNARTIRAWHYTRLMDNEVEAMRRDGIFPSNL